MNAIQISGGVDSMAMLWLLKPIWPESFVMWCDSGAAYQGTHELMKKVREMVPHFRTVHGNQPQVIQQFGYPVDVVPVKYSAQGEMMFGPQPVRFQSYFDCCRRSLWEPMQNACVAMGIDTIFRGQRSDEARKAPIPDGYTDPLGIKYKFPLASWTKDQVFEYVRKECPDLLLDYYKTEPTSRDCWSCTAFRDDNVERVKNLPPEPRAVVLERLAVWKTAVMEELTIGERHGGHKSAEPGTRQVTH